VVERALAAARRRRPAQGALPRPLRNLVCVVLAGGVAVLVACVAALAGDPLERPEHVAVLAAGMLLAELFPLRIPGREEETSFSTAFSFALLFSHGTAITVVVATACLVAADLARRRVAVKLAYNAAQYAVSWGAAGVVFTALAGAPDPALAEPPLGDLWALIPAGLAFVLLNGGLGALPGALIADGPAWPHLRHSYAFAFTTNAVLLTLAPVVVVVAAKDLWLVPLLGPLLAAIQVGSHQAVVNDARARLDPLTGAVTRRQLELALERRMDGDAQPSASPTSTTRSATVPATRCCERSRSGSWTSPAGASRSRGSAATRSRSCATPAVRRRSSCAPSRRSSRRSQSPGWRSTSARWPASPAARSTTPRRCCARPTWRCGWRRTGARAGWCTSRR
jgi:hypothetical protein